MKQRITIADINRRIQGLGNNTNQVLESANFSRPQDIKRFIETVNAPFDVYLNLYDNLIETGSISDVKKMGSYLAEEALPKTRDAKQTQTLLKRKLGNIKKKLGINNTKKQKSVSNSGISAGKQVASTKQVSQKQEAAIKAYDTMIEACTTLIHCDRIIENYNKISKRFNLELLFSENTRINGVRDTVLELCNRIDTYMMPDTVKFNTIIETAWYGFESNNIEYSKSDILDVAANYFSFKENGLMACKSILEATMLFDKNDAKDVDVLTEEEPESDAYRDPYANIREGHIIEYCLATVGKKNTPINESGDETDFNKIFRKFKQEELSKDDKPQNKLKQLVSKLYSRSVTGVIEDTPKLLGWIRAFFILGTCTIPMIGPVIMVIGFIADKFVSMHMERKEVEQMIRCFDNEIKTSKTKLSTLTNSDEKDKMNKYIDSLEKAKEKIENYYDNLLTNDEVSARYDDMFNSEDGEEPEPIDTSSMSDEELKKFMEDDDDDFNFDDFLEMASLVTNLTESIDKFTSNNSGLVDDIRMYQLIQDLDTDDLTSVATIASLYPDEFYKDDVYSGIKDNIADIRSGKIHISSVVEKAIRIAELQTAMDIMENTKPVESPVTIYDASKYFEIVSEAYGAISLMIEANYDKSNPIMEASISNTLKMASMKLKNALTKMSDKERSISKSIDIGLNSLTKGVERALSNDNREAVIKGSILPSASKLIKLGIANAGLIAIGQPVLAAITTLGYLGTSAKFKAKERQMLVDEIEIELKMCQKYIDIAESKNDMKALKQLLMTQRDLERQHQRIKYKMKAELGQKYYDAKHVGDK